MYDLNIYASTTKFHWNGLSNTVRETKDITLLELWNSCAV